MENPATKKYNYQLNQLYPQYFFHATQYSEFFVISTTKNHTTRFMKDLQSLYITENISPENLEGLKATKYPMLSNNHKHLKRIFKDSTIPNNNLILLIEKKDLQDIKVQEQVFLQQIDDFIKKSKQNYSIGSDEVVELRTVNLPVSISAGRMKEVENQKEWGYNFKVDLFGDYTAPKIDVQDIPVEYLNLVQDNPDKSVCMIYNPKIKAPIVVLTKKLTDITQGSIRHAVMDSLELFGQKLIESEKTPQKVQDPHQQDSLLGKRDPKEEGYYVCYNLWVLLSHPPCVMCSMALTHSRISRLYYFEDQNLVCGQQGLESGCQTHNINDQSKTRTPQIFCDPRLNHNYNVYKISKS